MRKKSLAMLLALLLGLVSPTPLAVETGESGVETVVETVSETVTVDPAGMDLSGNAELFADYGQRLLYPDQGVSSFGNWGGSNGGLKETEKPIYAKLKSEIASVAKNGGSTVFKLETSNITWKTDKTGRELRTEATEKFSEAVDTGKILNFLLADCPYELYWFDKTKTGGITWGYSVTSGGGGASISALTVTFKVTKAYQGGNATTVAAEKAIATAGTVATAQNIVKEHANKSDYEKLLAYKDEICKLTSYNNSVAVGSYKGGYGDPWQIIYVFDNNPATSVVCEGYAKAFQYLCDLSTFTGDTACYTVSGTMAGGKGAGSHMWNVVTLEGKNYLVDVTNSDESMIGQYGGLFLAETGGVVGGGYAFAIPPSSTITYTYDADMTAMYGNSILTLAQG